MCFVLVSISVFVSLMRVYNYKMRRMFLNQYDESNSNSFDGYRVRMFRTKFEDLMNFPSDNAGFKIPRDVNIVGIL